MSTLQATASIDYLPGPMALAHTYNSRGELGMFVNPYACSCMTCVNHVAHEHGHLAHEQSHDATTAEPPRQISLSSDQANALKKALTSRIEELKRQQDAISHDDARSHDEMAAMDAEWDELDAEIHQLEGIVETLE